MPTLRRFTIRCGLFVLCCALFAGCSGGSGGGSDAGTDGGEPTLEVTLGKRAGERFEAFDSAEPAFEIISGFQGGFHIEPAIQLEPPDASTFITVVRYSVTDVDTGEVLSMEPSGYRIDSSGWRSQDGALVPRFERVVLDVVDPGEAAGRQVRIDVEVDVEGGLGHGSDSAVVDLVDEVDEFGSPCPPMGAPPMSFGEECAGDGECGDYLRCREQSCAWPQAMTGETDSGTTTVEITGDKSSLTVPAELAESDVARSRGLAHRPCMQSDWAMLFIHPDEEELSYTVEDMRLDLDIIFADADGRVVSVHRDVQARSEESVVSGAPALYALELPAGELDEAGVGEPLEVMPQ